MNREVLTKFKQYGEKNKRYIVPAAIAIILGQAAAIKLSGGSYDAGAVETGCLFASVPIMAMLGLLGIVSGKNKR